MSRALFLETVRKGQRFLVTCHRRPDADALGSALGFSDVLRILGKDVVTCSPDEVPATLLFLPGLETLAHSFEALPGKFDATFVMDTASAMLLPKGFPPRDVTGTVVVLDHHAAFDDFADVVVRDADMCATGELVLSLAVDLGVLPRDLSLGGATALYAAVVADTGGFRYASTRPRTLRVAADLLEAGVSPWTVAYNLFEGWAPSRVALLQEVLAGMTMHFDNRMAVLTVTRDMLARTGANADMVDGLVQFARSVRGVEVAALLWEQDAASSDLHREPSTKVSMRAAGDKDVSKVAVALGGGGHRAAAACTVGEPVDATRTKLLSQATALLFQP